MAKQQYDAHVASTLGDINITTNVLETIAAQAALEVEGVRRLHASFQHEIGEFLGRNKSSMGTTMDQDDYGNITIDVEVHLEYGYSVPTVAMKVQKRIKEQILFMTDLSIQEVNVHIVSIETEDEVSPDREA